MMKPSKHAAKRSQQRAIADKVTQLIVAEGEGIDGTGGAIFYRIPEGYRTARTEYLREELRLWEQVKGKAVLAEGPTIITVLHLHKQLSCN